MKTLLSKVLFRLNRSRSKVLSTLNRSRSKVLSTLNRLLNSRGLVISSLEPRPKWAGEVFRFEYQKVHNQFEFQPGEVVLDIGSGGDPFPHATLLTDLYVEPTHHRGIQLVINGKPFFLSALEKLPLTTKSVDFIYCTHVLEHVEDPISACAEIVRVGKRGYVETPTLAKDMLFSWAKGMHKWHLASIDNKLIFFEYSQRQLEGVRSPVWRDLIYSQYFHPLQETFFDNQDLFNVMFNWQNGFECFVFYLDGRFFQKTLS